MANAPLPVGLYERLISRSVREMVKLAEQSGLRTTTEEATGAALEVLLSRHLGKSVAGAIRDSTNAVELANNLQLHLDSEDEDPIETPGTILRSVTKGLAAMPIS